MEDRPIITVKNLKTYFYTNQRCNKAINGVSFQVKKGKTLCVVGESGCGKSVTASSIMQLLPKLSRIEEGEIIYHGENGDIRIDQLERNGKEMRNLRGKDIAMIFQDPMTALNPVYTIGYQIMENILGHEKVSKKEAYDRTLNLLIGMGIPFPEQRINEYPHQFSGGMRQRAMIAMAMSCNPKVLIADEPTTALDVTIQAQIFELMEKLKRDYETAILLITHDMGVVAELADEVAVMYMGNIIESGDVREVLKTPAHPYTEALLKSIPILGKGREQELHPIKGSTPDPFDRPIGCQFAPRCNYACEKCNTMPSEEIISKTHMVRCWKHKEVINNGSK
ncbi:MULTISPECIES: ABC transporter ATP-binding protein [Clostridium]|jgi:oligopeptide/dipeptide ABC transporter ATP-binding protein|uniref:ABC transporter ATP-binding protein n=1 Tax=Clostridium butyricum TaxID=1492 RepID=A0AAP9RCN1_CLOBU|nr:MULTISPECIES: ABC transporter ATP-binding protein [Clostridium]MDU4853830.1 ABC transporter ATP-binding protein [Clostridioides difficile]ALP91481.1 peptide ABC transporter ATP-binding protein [Clostridium butyricum]ALS17977.1 peptide ABC transporter ATP-binding protein [Clostridium butyricum]ANF15101.1 peptide ABC transporter ATP-binding protein [Clostridium butyricum]AOR95112.1 peptide ABC transporter ATP-binding protein [Clostridium butyricum]